MGIIFTPFYIIKVLIVLAFTYAFDFFIAIAVAIKIGYENGLPGIFTKLFDSSIVSKMSTGISRLFLSDESTTSAMVREEAPETPAVNPAFQALSVKETIVPPFDFSGYLTESTLTDKKRVDWLENLSNAEMSKISLDQDTRNLYVRYLTLKCVLPMHDSSMGINQFAGGVKTDAVLDQVYEKDGQLLSVPGSSTVIRFTKLEEVSGILCMIKPENAAQPFEDRPVHYRLYRFPKGGFMAEFEDIQQQIIAIAERKGLLDTRESATKASISTNSLFSHTTDIASDVDRTRGLMTGNIDNVSASLQ